MNVIIGVQTGKFKKSTFEVYFGPGYKNNKVEFFDGQVLKPYDAEEFGPFFNTHLNIVFGINIGRCLY
jgi:hypothetical protein